MSSEHNCNLENMCLMTVGTLKSILVAYQENPTKIPDICEKTIKKLERLQKRELIRRSLNDSNPNPS